ncbi:hypothetical protein DYL59_18640 [Pseudomonas kairouanensis]|uniref:Uncharacterized protein n=1 Tax=Pseudomonas kairouanensis TaxID=2293832 RepID=A0A4Z0AL71_9PSED|nr:hypothetical protein [Pseudomonas kairouanensis]TFY87375.1 hypothetical protein DYL59_18640 [Pseudomonas kairouanensis]
MTYVMLTVEQLRHTKATNPFVIKNPDQVTNAFTSTDKQMAADKLKLTEREQIEEVKNLVRGHDMTSISSKDLREIGLALNRTGLIDDETFWVFSNALLATDENSKPTLQDVKFNALALFNERYEEYRDFLESNPRDVNKGTLEWQQALVAANHAISALSYFSNSTRADLAIDERA